MTGFVVWMRCADVDGIYCLSPEGASADPEKRIIFATEADAIATAAPFVADGWDCSPARFPTKY